MSVASATRRRPRRRGCGCGGRCRCGDTGPWTRRGGVLVVHAPVADRRGSGYAGEEGEVGGTAPGPDAVRWVQLALNQLLGLRLAVDGIPGPQTRGAVRTFQQKNGLAATGDVDAPTSQRMVQALEGTGGSADAARADPCAGLKPREVLDRFDRNLHFVRPPHQPRIIRIARCILASRKTAAPIRVVRMVGHASIEGDEGYNQTLGQARADEVRRHLLATLERILPGSSAGLRVETASRGEKEARSAVAEENRKVEIFLPLPEKKKPVPPKRIPPKRVPPKKDRVPPEVDKLLEIVKKILGSLPLGKIGVKLPTRVRFLTAAEQSEAMKVYVGSLDFTKILISDGLGMDGRKFTVAVPLSIGWHVVMNMGDVAPWETSPRSNTLIHELAHAWQSQHHGSDPTAFMKNSVRCQALAAADVPVGKAAAAAAATAAAVRRGVLDPAALKRIAEAAAAAEDSSAYAYVPGKAFDQYAAEQIAQQVEDGYRGRGTATPGVVAVVRSVSANARSADNERSLGVTSFHRKSTPGVAWR